jgi:pimeloyl-ACP methyl ester carboxylesterase
LRGRWQAQVRRGGVPQRAKSFDKRSDAERWARELEAEADRSGWVVDMRLAERTRLGELLTRYCAEVTPTKISHQRRGAKWRYVQARPCTLHPGEADRRSSRRQFVTTAIGTLERYKPTDAAREDYLSSYECERFAESMRYVRTYPEQLPVVRDPLTKIGAPLLIINGVRDAVVPPVNAEYLHERLPKSKLDIMPMHYNTIPRTLTRPSCQESRRRA